MNKKVILMILDGWGIATNPEVSAIDQAKTPFMDSLYGKYSNSRLNASGLFVGLPDGQMGNSEVGHMNIGAGRIVYQDLVKINKAIEEKVMDNNKHDKEDERDIWFILLAVTVGMTFFLIVADVIIKLTK